jgi:hypothetical protein
MPTCRAGSSTSCSLLNALLPTWWRTICSSRAAPLSDPAPSCCRQAFSLRRAKSTLPTFSSATCRTGATCGSATASSSQCSDFLDRHGIRYDGRLRFAEDFDLYLRCLVAGARFWLTPEAGYVYTIREGSLTDTHTARDLLRLRRVDRRLLRRPETAADDRLRAALHRHLRSIDRRAIWRLFTDALKLRAWRRAARIALLSPCSAAIVASELARVLPRRLGRLRHPAPAAHGRPLSLDFKE